MKIFPNILKAFLVNFCFIGLVHSVDSCPALSPKIAADSPPEQVEAIINDVICSFIDLNAKNNSTFSNTLNLTKKKIIPYIDIEYSTELALGNYWDDIDLRSRKIFERDIKNSLINDYVTILADMKNWEEIDTYVDQKYTQQGNIANVNVKVSLRDVTSNATVTLKLIRKKRWKIYDLVYQSISILDIEKIGYDSKIKRHGIDQLIQKMLDRS